MVPHVNLATGIGDFVTDLHLQPYLNKQFFDCPYVIWKWAHGGEVAAFAGGAKKWVDFVL
jgi:hypothetical protein